MNYRVEEIESRLRSGEDSGWEFKQVQFAGDRPKQPTRGDWADEIAAFANAAGAWCSPALPTTATSSACRAHKSRTWTPFWSR